MKLNPGSYSHGTLRPQDLIPNFLAALPSENTHDLLTSEAEAWVATQELLDNDQGNFVDIDKHNAAALDLVNGLITTLNLHTPQGHYFGSHIGDGSDFGIWPVEWLDLKTWVFDDEDFQKLRNLSIELMGGTDLLRDYGDRLRVLLDNAISH